MLLARGVLVMPMTTVGVALHPRYQQGSPTAWEPGAVLPSRSWWPARRR